MTIYAPPPWLRRGLAGMVLLLLALFGALQTEPGQDLLARALEHWLSSPTSRVTVHHLRGQMPWNVQIDRLAWADTTGVWLEMQQVSLRWSLDGATLHIQEAGAERVHLHRQPHTEATPPKPTPSTPPALPGRLPSLLVDRLHIAQLLLDAAASGQAARLSLTGEIRHSNSDPGHTPSLHAHLLLRPLDAGNTRLNLQARLLPAGPVTGESRLTLTLEGEEKNGLTAAWTGLPQAQGMHLQLTGDGPLATWEGRLAASVAGVGGLQGQVTVHHTHHTRLHFAGRAETELALIGKEWAKLLAPVETARDERGSFDLELQGEWQPTRSLHLSQLAIRSPAARLSGQGQWTLSDRQLQATLQGEIPRLAVLEPLAGLPLQGSLTTTLAVQGAWPTPQLQWTLQADESVVGTLRAKQWQAEWTGSLAEGDVPWHGQGQVTGLQEAGIDWGGERWSWSADLIQPAIGPLRLTQLHCTDQNLSARLQGNLPLDERGGEGRWQVEVARLADWVKPIHPPVTGSGQWSGLLTLTPPSSATSPLFTTTVTGGVSALQGLPDPLHILLGSAVQTEARVAWWAGGRLEVADMQVRGAGVQWQGSLQAELEKGRTAGRLLAQIPRLAPFSDLAGVPLQGGVEADLQWEGPLTTPHLQARLRTPVIDIGPVHWEDPDLLLTVDGLTTTPHGSIRLELPEPGTPRPGKGGRVTATGTYRLQGAQLQLADLRLPWPGGEVTGERLQVDLRHWVLEGRLQGRSTAPGRWVQWLAGEANPLPRDLEGTLAVQWHLMGEGSRQALEATLEAQGVRGKAGLLDKGLFKAKVSDLWGVPNGTLEGTLERLRWGKSQVRVAQWQVAGSRQSAQVTMSGKGVLATGEPPSAKPLLPVPAARPTAGRLPADGFELEANGTLGMDGKGVVRGTLAGLTGRIGPEAVQLEEAVRVVLTPGGRRGVHLDLERLAVRYGGARLTGQARYDAQRVEVVGDLTLPLALASRFGGPEMQGTAQARLRLEGSARQPEGQLTLQMEKVHLKDPSWEAMPPVTIQAAARLEKGQVNLNGALRGLTPQPVTALLLFPLQVGVVPFQFALPAGGPLEGTLNADTPLAQFALLAAPELLDEQKLDGQLQIALRLGGTLREPELLGEIHLSNGRYENGSLGTLVKEIRLDAKANGRTIAVERLEATDGGQGRLRATGQLSLDVVRRFPFRLEANLERGKLVRRDEWQATLSGPLVVQGSGERVEVTGSLTGNELLLYLSGGDSLDTETVAIDREVRNGVPLVVGEGMPAVATPTPVVLNVALHLPNRVFLRGRGLESEWQGDLAIRGQAEEPQIDGQILVRRGYFEFLDQKFELRKGIIAFDGTTTIQPSLDLEAESRSINGVVAVLRLRGPAFTPTLQLGSEPELPQDEILARMLFNRNRQQLTPAQAVSLAVAVEKLRSGGPGLLGRARETLGIDRLELGGESIEAGSVKAGKYIQENILLGVERGLKQGSGKVSVELEMTPNITLQTEMDETNKSGVGVNWKVDY